MIICYRDEREINRRSFDMINDTLAFRVEGANKQKTNSIKKGGSIDRATVIVRQPLQPLPIESIIENRSPL